MKIYNDKWDDFVDMLLQLSIEDETRINEKVLNLCRNVFIWKKLRVDYN